MRRPTVYLFAIAPLLALCAAWQSVRLAPSSGMISVSTPHTPGIDLSSITRSAYHVFRADDHIFDTTAKSGDRLSHALNATALAALVNMSSPVMRDDVGAIYTDTGSSCVAPDGYAEIQPTLKGSAYAGHCWQINWHSIGDVVNPVIWGARFEGVATSAVDTAAVQAALNTKLPVHMPRLGGTFVTSACLTFGAAGQLLYGDGGVRTQIIVPATLDKANSPLCTGIFSSIQAEPGPIVRDVGVTFQQVDTNNPALLHTYPPLFNFQNTPRFRIENVVAAGCTICLDMRGDSGGAYVDNLQYSAFNKGIWIDGSRDTVHITKPHWYPVNLTEKQLEIFNEQAIGIYSGRMDDLIVDKGLFIGNQAIRVVMGATGPTFGNISDTDFDTYSGIAMYGGTLTCASCTFTVGPDTVAEAFYALNLAAGQFTCSACNFGSGGASHALVYMPKGSKANVTLNGPVFNMGQFDRPAVQEYSGVLSMTGAQVIKSPSDQAGAPLIYNFDVIDIRGGRFLASNNFLSDRGISKGSALAINIKTDAANRVIGNSAFGWGCKVGGRNMPNSLSQTSAGGVYAAGC